MNAARKTSVKGRSYILHIRRGDKTLCGRVAAKVNCAAGPTEESEVCRACKAREAREQDR